MPRFAANLTTMYHEHPFLERFAAAASDGFKGVEILFPTTFRRAELRSSPRGRTADEQALFTAPPGDWAKGERGLASLPGREDDFKRTVDTALEYARVLGNRCLHVMAGLLPARRRPRAPSRALRARASLAARAGDPPA